MHRILKKNRIQLRKQPSNTSMKLKRLQVINTKKMSKETKEAKGAKAAKEGKEINKEKLKALQLTLDKLEKTYGKGSIMKMGDKAIENVEVIPTGSLSLDIALGIGGLPKGRV